MSQSSTTPLASAQVNRDQVAVELVEPDGRPARVRIVWPSAPTIVDPKRFPETAAAIATLFARAHIVLASRRRGSCERHDKLKPPEAATTRSSTRGHDHQPSSGVVRRFTSPWFDTIADVSTSDKIAKATDSTPIELSDSENLAAEVGGGVTAGFFALLITVVLGPHAGAVAGMALTPMSERWIARCIKEFRPRSQVLAEGASLTSGLDEEEIVERLVESPELQPLVARILDAAARTNSTETLRLLGAILGASVSGRPRKIDEDLMLVDGITGLEPGHLSILELFENPADPSRPDVYWTIETITAANAGSLSPVGLQVAMGGLIARGLIQTVSGFGGGGYMITDFGRALLDALHWSRPGHPTSPTQQA